MKALTLHQPWASLIADGRKRYETRSWVPRVSQLRVGDLLAIHAGATVVEDCVYDLYGLTPAAVDLPTRAVLCVCRLTAMRHTEGLVDDISDEEFDYGDWSPGRWAWGLEVIERFDPPIPARGMQGLWDWDAREAMALRGEG